MLPWICAPLAIAALWAGPAGGLGGHGVDVIVHVVLPSSRTILVTLAPITVVSQERVHVAAGDHQRPQVAGADVATAGLQSQYDAQCTLVLAATTVAIAPSIVLFLVFQRHIVRSIVVTGLK